MRFYPKTHATPASAGRAQRSSVPRWKPGGSVKRLDQAGRHPDSERLVVERVSENLKTDWPALIEGPDEKLWAENLT